MIGDVDVVHAREHRTTGKMDAARVLGGLTRCAGESNNQVPKQLAERMRRVARDGRGQKIIADPVDERHVAASIGEHFVGIFSGPFFIDGVAVAEVLHSRTSAVEQLSRDMRARGVMSHTGGDGSNPGERIARTGYVSATWGENVAAGYPSVEAVMAGWLGSDGHCANLMNPGFTEFGGGETDRYWAQVFARPR